MPVTQLLDRRSRRRFLSCSAAAVALPLAQAACAATPSGRHPLKLGVTTYSFRELSLDDALRMTRKLGLKHISLKSFHLPLEASHEQIVAVAGKVRRTGLDFYGVGVISMSQPAHVEQAFAYASAAGVRLIMGMPTAALLPLIEQRVKKTGVGLAIHNHGPGDRNFPTPDKAYDAVRQLDRRIGLCIDVGHTVRAGADPVECVLKYGDRLLDMHMKDVTRAAPNGKEVPVGRGVIDIPALLRALVKVHYQGVIAFEYELEPKDPLAGMAESVGYTRGVLAAI